MGKREDNDTLSVTNVFKMTEVSLDVSVVLYIKVLLSTGKMEGSVLSVKEIKHFEIHFPLTDQFLFSVIKSENWHAIKRKKLICQYYFSFCVE